MFKSLFFVAISAGLVFLVAFPGLTQAEPEMYKQNETVIEFDSQVPVDVGNKICPVSGEEVGQGGMEPALYEYEGKIYNFCCAGCIEEFKKDPEKYIKKVEEELKEESSMAE